MLTVLAHDRDSAGMTYVYPVLSRRAGGVSLGINLNVNRACNWACVYCQVEGLTRGGPEPVDLGLLEKELNVFLDESDAWLEQHAPPEHRRIVDIAFSGDGEPTSAAEFAQAVGIVGKTLKARGLTGRFPVRLITNGSLIQRSAVQDGLRQLAALSGEVWFKVDRGDEAEMLRANQTRMQRAQVQENLRRCAALVPTWLQTCWFAFAGQPPTAQDEAAYLAFIAETNAALRGICLYAPRREPHLAPGVSCLPETDLRAWGEKIEQTTGLLVRVAV
ncbi:MAG: radical SAM protein [Zoogloeaceae bacterium]|nr:radical SAM protein [Zoogloeaceae bacterium]